MYSMGPYIAPHVADLFLFCYEKDLMLSRSSETRANVIEPFNSTYRLA